LPNKDLSGRENEAGGREDYLIKKKKKEERKKEESQGGSRSLSSKGRVSRGGLHQAKRPQKKGALSEEALGTNKDESEGREKKHRTYRSDGLARCSIKSVS